MTTGSREASPERRLDSAALLVALFLIALAALTAWDAAHMRSGVAAYSRISPRAFPYAIAIGLAVLAVLTAVQAFREPAPPHERDEIAPMAWIVGALIAQIVLLPVAGFSIATGAVFAGTAKGLGRGRLWFTFPVGILFALFVWVFFAMALQLVLPAGPLEELARDIVSGLSTTIAAWF